MKSLKFLPLALLLLLPGFSYAKTLEVDVILDLLDSRVSESSIRRFVERNQFTLNLSAGDLMDLKKAGASDDLIEFLQQREEEGTGEDEGESEPSVSPENGGGGSAGYEPMYSGTGVYFGVGFGYPYDYYYPYYPYYSYYPYYPYYPYHCSYYGGHYHGTTYYSSGHGGSGVYSYNRTNGRPRGSQVGSVSSGTTISGRITSTLPPSGSGRITRTAPPSGSGTRVTRPGGGPSSTGRSFSGSYHAPRSGAGVSRGMGAGRGMVSSRGMSSGRGGGFHGGSRGGGGGRGRR